MIAINDLVSNADLTNVAGGTSYRWKHKHHCKPKYYGCYQKPNYYGYPLAATSETLQFSQKASVAFEASNETNLFINRTSIPTPLAIG